MSNFRSYHKSWHNWIMNHENINEVKNQTGLSEKTLNLYKGFVNNHYEEALKKMFPRIQDLIDFDWNNITKEYFKEYPPYAWEINELAFNFSQYARDYLKLEECFYELLEYEICEFKTYKKKAIQVDSDCYQINPAHEILQFEYEIANWVKYMDELEKENRMEELKDSRPQKNPNILMITRNPQTGLCLFSNVAGLEIAIYEILKQVNVFRNEYRIILKNIKSLLGEEVIKTITIDHIKSSIQMMQKQFIIL